MSELVTCRRCGRQHAPEERCTFDTDPRLGSVLEGKYEIVRVIGEGGMGRVYEARHRQTTRRVAVKFVSTKHETNREVTQRFEREARAAGGLEHPNIAAVLDFGRTPEGIQYLILEYLEGETCRSLLEREGALPVPRAVNIAAQICDGLGVAHDAGIVHRDLKPANLFVCKRSRGQDTELVKVLDFGIAKLRLSEPDARETPSGASLGTPQYMSPEQARGAKSVDRRADIYVLGVILYELLSNRRAHGGDSPLEIVFNILHTPPERLGSLRPELPAALVAAVERARATEPERRFQSTGEFKQTLKAFSWSARRSTSSTAGFLDGGDATRPSEDPIVTVLPSRRSALVSDPPTVTPVSSAARPPSTRTKPWVRAFVFAFAAIGAGALGGWLASGRPEREASRTQGSAEGTAAVASERRAEAPPATALPTPRHAESSSTSRSDVPVTAAAAKTITRRSRSAPEAPESPVALAASVPLVAPAASWTSNNDAPRARFPVPSSGAPRELWKADEQWLDRQK